MCICIPEVRSTQRTAFRSLALWVHVLRTPYFVLNRHESIRPHTLSRLSCQIIISLQTFISEINIRRTDIHTYTKRRMHTCTCIRKLTTGAASLPMHVMYITQSSVLSPSVRTVHRARLGARFVCSCVIYIMTCIRRMLGPRT